MWHLIVLPRLSRKDVHYANHLSRSDNEQVDDTRKSYLPATSCSPIPIHSYVK